MRYAEKRDIAELDIVPALEAHGARVWKLNGKALPDLLVRYRGVWFVAECKTPKIGRLTPAQKAAHVELDWPIWRTVEDALSGIGVLG